MKLLLELLKSNLELAKAEAEALFGKGRLEGGILLLDSSFIDFGRLAFTKAAYELLFECSAEDAESKAASFGWQKFCKGSFCTRVHNAPKEKEKQFADIVWKTLESPKVCLRNPDSEFHFFFENGRMFAARLIKEICHSELEARRPHLRPEMHPSSLHPKLARAFVNLTGIKSGKIIDPFCGTGGILLEAGLMGLAPEGSDIDDEMLKMAGKNLKSFGIECRLEKKDASLIRKKMNYLASDLPYAKATKSQDLSLLYPKFFSVLKKLLKKKAVIGLPDFTPNRQMLKDAGLNVEAEFTVYLHKSLSKKIYVISA